MQQDAGPAGAEHHLHLAGRCGAAVEIDEPLAQCLIHRGAPGRRRRHRVVAEASAGAEAAGLPPAVLLHHHRDVQPHQRPQVGDACPVGTHDLDRLPFAVQRGHHLLDARILATRIDVDLRQHRGAHGEVHARQRIGIGIEPGIGRARRLGHGAGMARRDRGHAARRPPQRGVRQFARMRIAGGFAGNRAQPEAQRGVEAGAADAAVVQADLFALAIFEKQLAVIAGGQRRPEMALGGGAVELGVGALEKQPIGRGEWGHAGASCPADGPRSGQINRLAGSRSSAVVPSPGRECNRRRPPCPSASARDM